MTPNPQNTATPQEEGPSLDVRELLGIIIKHRWIILGAIATVTILVLFWTLQQPKIYEAKCTLEYDPNPPRPLREEVRDVADPVGTYWMTREFYETQNQVIQSRAIAERVVRRLGLHRDPSFFGVSEKDRPGFRGRSIEQAARLVQARLSVEQEKETRIVEIRVQDRNPRRAKLIANAIADTYMEKTAEDRLGTSVNALEWLGTQFDDMKHKLDQTEFALHEFKKDNNIQSGSMKDRQEIVTRDIQHFSEKLTEARTKRVEIQARLSALKSANRDNPLEVHGSVISQSEALSKLRDQYATKVAERDSLAVRYGNAHPALRAVQANVTTLIEQIRKEIDGLIKAAENDLREVQGLEQGLRVALDDANQAGRELNAIAFEYDRLDRERANTEKLYNILLQRSTETNLTKLMKVSSARLIDRALEPEAPVKPKLSVNSSIGILAGLLLGLGLALVLTRLDRTVRTAEDAEALGLTVLGILPTIESPAPTAPRLFQKKRVTKAQTAQGNSTNKDLIVHAEPMSSVSECARTIRTNLTFMSADDPLRAIVVTSPAPREGKTTVATNLAIVIAQGGKRVLLIDTDLRRPRIHRTFGVSSEVGITSVLLGERTLDNAVRETMVPDLFILPCGPIPPNPAELLHTTKFRDLIRDATEKFDQVILDSPPLGVVTDAAIIAPQVQGAVIVIESKSTTRDALRSALRRLRDVNANLIGGVLNDVDLSARYYGQAYYYRYYYYRGDSYYTSPKEEESGQAAE